MRCQQTRLHHRRLTAGRRLPSRRSCLCRRGARCCLKQPATGTRSNPGRSRGSGPAATSCRRRLTACRRPRGCRRGPPTRPSAERHPRSRRGTSRCWPRCAPGFPRMSTELPAPTERTQRRSGYRTQNTGWRIAARPPISLVRPCDSSRLTAHG